MDRPKVTYDYEELLRRLAACPARGTQWRHYRGTEYVVWGKAIDEATGAALVLYHTSSLSCVFARPLSEWLEEVEHEGRRVPRYAEVP